MQSRAFRTVSALFTALLLIGLVAAVGWTVQTQPSTLVLPTATPTPTPTVTPTPPILLGAELRVDTGGYRFGPPDGYAVRMLDRTAMLTDPDESWPDGPLFTLDGGSLSALPPGAAATVTATLDTLLAQFLAIAAEQYAVQPTGAPVPLTLEGSGALAADLTGSEPAVAGRLVVALPEDGRYFVLLGLAPEGAWQGRAGAALAELAGSVGFFPPTILTPESTPTPQVTATPTAAPAAAGGAAARNTPIATTTAMPGRRATPAAETPTAGTTRAATVTATLTATAQPVATVRAPSAVTITTGVSLLPAPMALPVAAGPVGRWTPFSDANVVNDLALIGNTIWLATDGGALAWSKGSNNPVKFTTPSGLAANRLTAVVNCPLPGFGVVFGSDRGLQMIDPRTGRWQTLDSSDGGMRYDDVAALYCDPANEFLIVGYAAHGIDIYDAAEDEWRHLDRSSGLAANDVQRLAVIGDRNAIWVVSGDSVTVAAGADSTYYDADNSPLAGDRIGAVAVGEDGAVWLGGEGTLYQVVDEKWSVYGAENVSGDFPTGRIMGIGVDGDGALWLGSVDAEVCRFEPAAARCAPFFGSAPGMGEGPLTHLVVDRTGEVYYGTAGNGFSRYDGSQWRTSVKRDDHLAGNRVKATATDEDGNFWVATEAGVQRFGDVGEPGVLFDNGNSGIAPLGVRTLHPGAGGGMWVGSMQGASFFDGESWTTFSTADGLAGNTVQAIAVDSTGRTWFGTDRGLSVWNGEVFFNIARDRGLPSDDISALAADGDAMWIGTSGGGLYRFENSQLQILNRGNVGLPSDVITALAREGDGSLWIGTDQGLARLEDGALALAAPVGAAAITSLAVTPTAVWAGTTGEGAWYFDGSRWSRLTGADGLPADDVTSLLAAGDGVWIGGQDGGLVRFQP